MGSRFDPELHIYWGKKGSGKSHGAAAEIYDAIRLGIDCWTNIPINPIGFPKPRKGKKLGKIFVSDEPEDVAWMRYGLWVYDEAYMKLNSRKWGDLKTSVHEYMAQSRKTKMKIIIIAQSFKRIDLVLREICDQYVRFEKNLFGFGYRKIYGELDPVLDKYVDVRSEQHLYRRKVFKFYDTDALYGSLLEKLGPRQFVEVKAERAQVEGGDRATHSVTPHASTAAPALSVTPTGVPAPGPASGRHP